MKWEPEVIHIVMGSINEKGHGRLCGAKVKAWPEHCMDDKWARKLPICEDCKEEYEQRYGREYKKRTDRDYNSTPRPMKTERVGGLYLIDFEARSNKGTSEEQ